MKSTKLMLSAIMLMLLFIFAAFVDMNRNRWLGGTSLVFMLLAIIIFVVGLFSKKIIDYIG